MARKRFKLQPWEIFPCPRCASPDTRFFCYNGRDGTKPKHYCNACRRYWIRGSTLRHAKRVPRKARTSPTSSSLVQPLSSPATVTDRRLPSSSHYNSPAIVGSCDVVGVAPPCCRVELVPADISTSKVQSSPRTATGRSPSSSSSIVPAIAGSCHGGGKASYCGAELVSVDISTPRIQPSFPPGSSTAAAIAHCCHSCGVELLTADMVLNQEKSVEPIDICTWVDEELNRIIQEELCAAVFSSKGEGIEEMV